MTTITDNDVIKFEFNGERFAVHIQHDSFAENPRSFECKLGQMVCWHRRYRLGEKHNYSNPTEFRNRIKNEEYVALPLYLLDHGALHMRTIPFSDVWDSGQVGWIYATKHMFDELGLAAGADWRERAKEMLEQEVVLFDAYLNGETYSYTLYVGSEEEGWNEVESGCGFYGGDLETNGIADEIAGLTEALESRDYEIAQAEVCVTTTYKF